MSISPVVLKFGGTSMSDEHTWRLVMKIISGYKNPVVVVSATARTTRMLLQTARLAAAGQAPAMEKNLAEIRERHVGIISGFFDSNTEGHTDCLNRIEFILNKAKTYLEEIAKVKTVSAEMQDAIAGLGEQFSAWLFARCGEKEGLPLRYVEAAHIIKTDSNYGRATPDENAISRESHVLLDLLQQQQIPVLGGFYGEDSLGKPTTLGFEGSDYSASLLGAALASEAVEIWTDVSGVYTADPRLVSLAKPIPILSYTQATQMAQLGARVLHPSTLRPVENASIPVWVKNMFSPNDPGTCIGVQAFQNGMALGISAMQEASIGFMHYDASGEAPKAVCVLLEAAASCAVKPEILQAEVSDIILAVESSDAAHTLQASLPPGFQVHWLHHKAIVSLIGCRFKNSAERNNVLLEASSNSEVDFFVFSKHMGSAKWVVPQDSIERFANSLHRICFV